MTDTHTPSPPPVLAGEALTKRYGTTTAPDGASLAVLAGESVAVMGPSGSGKTSLLHCLAGIVRPDSGRVLLDGVPGQDWNETRRSELRRTRYGFVLQSGQLLPELPAEENIALPLLLAGQDVRGAVGWAGPAGGDRSGRGERRAAHDDERLRGREVVVVDPAATGVGAPRAVPGLTRFPAPGRAHLSPALAELVREHPTELATRSGPLAGQLGGQAAQYRSLAVIAITLIVVPLLVLAGAASRLGLARRDQRLAALRLAGATPRQVVVLTALESAFTAAAGAALGAAGAVLLVPLAAQVPVAGGRWYAADLVPPLRVLAGVLAGVIALALASAVSALRRVLTSALGVAAAHTPRRTGPIRVVVSAALLLAFLRYSESDDPSTGALVGAFATVFAALAVLGPWVVATLGRLVVHRAKGALALLAGRRMLDDSRGTWRVVGPVALTGFAAGTLALFPTGSEEVTWGSSDGLDVALPVASAQATATRLRTQLAAAGITSAASVLDRRRTYRQLALIGVPMAVLDRARSLETQVPLVLLAVGSTVTGIVAAAPLTRLGLSGSGVDLPGFVVLVGCTGLGLLGVRVACAASRPLLARVAADPASTSDRPLPPGEVAVPGPADRRLRSGPRFPGR